MLHPSGDLLGSLRHSQLRLAGAPTLPTDTPGDIRLMTGTMWHRYMGDLLVKNGVLFMQEIDVTPGLPKGWSGTADWLFWDKRKKAFVLGDLKTIKGEGLKWIETGGAKDEHIWQLSAYFWALKEMGLPMVDGFGVLYLPMNPDLSSVTPLEPVEQLVKPIARDLIWPEMEFRRRECDSYLADYNSWPNSDIHGQLGAYLVPSLAPERDREQKLVWNKSMGVLDLKLVPHWSTRYCPFGPPLCGCSLQRPEKVGHFDLQGNFVGRRGYGVNPEVFPTEADLQRRRKEISK